MDLAASREIACRLRPCGEHGRDAVQLHAAATPGSARSWPCRANQLEELVSKRIRDLNLLLGAVIGMGSLVGACAADERDPVDTVVATASAPQAAAACALPSVMARTNEETGR